MFLLILSWLFFLEFSLRNKSMSRSCCHKFLKINFETLESATTSVSLTNIFTYVEPAHDADMPHPFFIQAASVNCWPSVYVLVKDL